MTSVSLTQESPRSRRRVYLVDGSGYIFRAFYAVAPLTTAQGFPTNALFGFVRMLLKLLQQADSQHVVVVFDAGRITFRNELYSQYKANRSEPPPELVPQFPFFRKIVAALGVGTLDLPGFEADDVIATLATRLERSGIESVVVSADKDLMQLVGGKVSIWDTMKDKHFGPAEVLEKFGVPPERVVDFLGLTGDSSDNIPGLEGVGPKTAVQLIAKYGDVESIIKSVEAIAQDKEIRGRQKIVDQLRTNLDLVRLSRQLAEVRRDAPVKLPWLTGPQSVVAELSDEELFQALERRAPNDAELRELVQKLEFSSLLKELSLAVPRISPGSAATSAEYRAVFKEDFPAWRALLEEQREISFDLETTSLDPREAQVVGMSFCWADEEAFYVPLAHEGASECERQMDRAVFLESVKPLLENPAIAKCGQNLKYDVQVLAQVGITVRGITFDSMLAAYVLNPDRGSYNLTTLANEYLARTVIEFDEVVGGGASFAEVGIEAATRYACQDAHFVWLLKCVLTKSLEESELLTVFREIEMPLLPVLAHIELSGIKLDVEVLRAMSGEFEADLVKTESQIYELCGCEFNINSPKQLADVLFNKLGISSKGLKRTKTGTSTDSSVLEKLSHQHPVPERILHHRFLHKLKSTYLDSLPTYVSRRTGRLHTRLNQTGTSTGRLSSSEPNLQNIPIQTPEGRKIRSAFVAESGNLLLSADYSQIELRILAHLSDDKALIQAFRQGDDIHAATAREVLGLGVFDKITPEQRRVGKTINFGIVYGMSGFRLARDLEIPVSLGNQYIEEYFKRYPGVKSFMENLEREATEKGFVATMFGRKRTIAAIDTSERDRGFVMRAAMNAPIQGSAADLIKFAMVRIAHRLEREKSPAKMILQVHDELLFEVGRNLAPVVAALVKQEMEHAAELKVPLLVEVGSGGTWDEAH